MANYAYILNIRPSLTTDTFLAVAKAAIPAVLGPHWKIEWATWKFDGPTLHVTLPGTSDVVAEYWGASNGDNPPEDVGFTLSLKNKRTIAFRHSTSSDFQRWAQGCVEEELSERLGAPLHYDAGPTTYPPGRREYRRGKTFREYCLRNFGGKVEDASHAELLARMMRGTPPGFET